jgi:hypothetical protein
MRQLAILSSIVLLLVGCGGTTGAAPADAGAEDAASPGAFVVISGGVKQLEALSSSVIMADGRIIRFDRPKELTFKTLVAPPAFEMREQTILTTSGEIHRRFYGRSGEELSKATGLDGRGPYRLFRNGWVRTANGGVFGFEYNSVVALERPGVAGADQCAYVGEARGHICLFDGLAREVEPGGSSIDIGGRVVDLADAHTLLYPGTTDFRNYEGVALLREDGALFAYVGGAAGNPRPPVVRIGHGLPPIARLHRGFFEDRQGKMWYFGVAPPESWPLGLIAPGVPRYPCLIDWAKPKTSVTPTSCVYPVEIPALAHTSPMAGFAGMAVVAITHDGKLLCWPNSGRTCFATCWPNSGGTCFSVF